jgi:hypothetical protein
MNEASRVPNGTLALLSNHFLRQSTFRCFYLIEHRAGLRKVLRRQPDLVVTGAQVTLSHQQASAEDIEHRQRHLPAFLLYIKVWWFPK